MKDHEKTRYVCLGCNEYLTAKEVREDVRSENLCAKCKDKSAQHKSEGTKGDRT